MGKRMGRPSTFTKTIAKKICERLMQGESLRSICSDKDMPHKGQVLRWLTMEQHKDFRAQYTQAREAQAHGFTDKIQDYIDQLEDGRIKPDAARVAIDAIKWIAGKHAPRTYSDKQKIELEHSGEITQVTRRIVKNDKDD